MDTKFPPPAEFNRHLVRRLRYLRRAAGLTQAAAAKAVGIPLPSLSTF